MSVPEFIQALQAALGVEYGVELADRHRAAPGYVALRVRRCLNGILHVYDVEVRADVVEAPASADPGDLADRIRQAGANLERYTVRVVRYPGPPLR